MKFLLLFISLLSFNHCSNNKSSTKTNTHDQNQVENLSDSIDRDSTITRETLKVIIKNKIQDSTIVSPNSAPDQKLIDSIKNAKTKQKQIK